MEFTDTELNTLIKASETRRKYLGDLKKLNPQSTGFNELLTEEQRDLITLEKRFKNNFSWLPKKEKA
jgi:hypothetical protein